MPGDNPAVTLVMRVEDDTVVLPTEHFCQGSLAVLDWRAAQIIAVQLDQIERAKD